MSQRIDPALVPPRPTLDFETALWQAGVCKIGGIDEAGRGALAGPVVAATVILNPDSHEIKQWKGVRDSKCMTLSQREKWRPRIQAEAWAWGVGFASSKEIDALGIVPATRLAAQRALDEIPFRTEHLLLDYLQLPENPLPQTWLIKGDARSLSIAAASILAKTIRDDYLCKIEDTYPDYGFSSHKGYGTKAHRQAIEKLGPSPIHRMSFAPMRFM